MIGLGVVVVVARLSILSDPIWMHQLRGNMHFRVFTSYFHGIILEKIQFPFLRLSLLLIWFIFARSVGVTISCGLIVLLIQRGMLIWPEACWSDHWYQIVCWPQWHQSLSAIIGFWPQRQHGVFTDEKNKENVTLIQHKKIENKNIHV